MTSEWGYSEEGLKHYTACRTIDPIVVDGQLDEASWQHAVRSPRFEDLEEPGRPGLFDTRAAVLWLITPHGDCKLRCASRPRWSSALID